MDQAISFKTYKQSHVTKRSKLGCFWRYYIKQKLIAIGNKSYIGWYGKTVNEVPYDSTYLFRVYIVNCFERVIYLVLEILTVKLSGTSCV